MNTFAYLNLMFSDSGHALHGTRPRDKDMYLYNVILAGNIATKWENRTSVSGQYIIQIYFNQRRCCSIRNDGTWSISRNMSVIWKLNVPRKKKILWNLSHVQKSRYVIWAPTYNEIYILICATLILTYFQIVNLQEIFQFFVICSIQYNVIKYII